MLAKRDKEWALARAAKKVQRLYGPTIDPTKGHVSSETLTSFEVSFPYGDGTSKPSGVTVSVGKLTGRVRGEPVA